MLTPDLCNSIPDYLSTEPAKSFCTILTMTDQLTIMNNVQKGSKTKVLPRFHVSVQHWPAADGCHAGGAWSPAGVEYCTLIWCQCGHLRDCRDWAHPHRNRAHPAFDFFEENSKKLISDESETPRARNSRMPASKQMAIIYYR